MSSKGPMVPAEPWRRWLNVKLEELSHKATAEHTMISKANDGSQGELAMLLGTSDRRLYGWLKAETKSVRAWTVEDCLWEFFHNTGELVSINDVYNVTDILDCISERQRKGMNRK